MKWIYLIVKNYENCDAWTFNQDLYDKYCSFVVLNINLIFKNHENCAHIPMILNIWVISQILNTKLVGMKLVHTFDHFVAWLTPSNQKFVNGSGSSGCQSAILKMNLFPYILIYQCEWIILSFTQQSLIPIT